MNFFSLNWDSSKWLGSQITVLDYWVPFWYGQNTCPTSPFIKVGKKVKAAANNTVVAINKPVNCQTKNLIYCISCKKCPTKQYIGETDRTLQARFADHRGYVNNKHLTKATGVHFNRPGHDIADMEVTILEKVFSRDSQFRKNREKMFIQDFNTKYKGLNKKIWIANCK